MRVTSSITARNLLLFFRDPLNVFFSLMGALVVFLLYVLFLGNVQVDSIQAVAPGADADLARGFVDAWMFAGIVSLSTVTTPLGALSVFVEDSASGRFKDFLVSPVRRGQLVQGYLASALIVGLSVTLLVFVIALLYMGLVNGTVLSLAAVARCLAWIVLSTAAFTALWAFVASFLRSTGAFAGASTIVGTVAGFIAGAYVAVGLFPDAVRDGVSALPFAQSAMLLRSEFTGDALSALVGGDEAAVANLNAFYGITLSVGSWAVPGWFAAAVLAVMTAAFAALATVRIRSRIA